MAPSISLTENIVIACDLSQPLLVVGQSRIYKNLRMGSFDSEYIEDRLGEETAKRLLSTTESSTKHARNIVFLLNTSIAFVLIAGSNANHLADLYLKEKSRYERKLLDRSYLNFAKEIAALQREHSEHPPSTTFLMHEFAELDRLNFFGSPESIPGLKTTLNPDLALMRGPSLRVINNENNDRRFQIFPLSLEDGTVEAFGCYGDHSYLVWHIAARRWSIGKGGESLHSEKHQIPSIPKNVSEWETILAKELPLNARGTARVMTICHDTAIPLSPNYTSSHKIDREQIDEQLEEIDSALKSGYSSFQKAIKLPLIGSSVNTQDFLLLAPWLITVIALYLKIYLSMLSARFAYLEKIFTKNALSILVHPWIGTDARYSSGVIVKTVASLSLNWIPVAASILMVYHSLRWSLAHESHVWISALLAAVTLLVIVILSWKINGSFIGGAANQTDIPQGSELSAYAKRYSSDLDKFIDKLTTNNENAESTNTAQDD